MNIATSQAEHGARRIANGEDPRRVIEAAIHAALAAMLGTLTPGDYAKRAGISMASAYKRLEQLAADGEITRRRRGVYEVAQ